MLGCELVIGGPRIVSRSIGGRIVQLRVPGDEHDLASVLSRLPAEQYPDVYAAHVGAESNLSDLRLDGVRCRTVLVVEDSGMATAQVDAAVALASSAGFERVIVTGDSRRVAAFSTTATGKVFWNPGFLARCAGPTGTDVEARPIGVCVKGSIESIPSRTLEIAKALASGGLPVEIRDEVSVEEEIPGTRSPFSLAGDEPDGIGAKTLEVASSRIPIVPHPPRHGLEDGKNCISFRSSDELIKKLRALEQRPVQLEAMQAAARHWSLAWLSPELRLKWWKHVVSSNAEVDRVPVSTSVQAVNPAEECALRVRSLCERGAYQEALALGKAMIAAHPKSASGYLALSSMASIAGNRELGEKMLARAEQVDRDSAQVYWSRMLFEAGRSPGACDPNLQQGWAAYEQGDLSKAYGVAVQQMSGGQATASALHLKGLALFELALQQKDSHVAHYHFSQAIQALRAALSLSGHPAIEWDLGHVCRRAGLIPEAIASLKRVLPRMQEAETAFFALGEAYCVAGNYAEAVAVFTEGLRHYPESDRLLLWMGHCRKRLGYVAEGCALQRRGLIGEGAVGGDPLRSRRRVVFLAQHPPMWTNTESVYRAFASDPEWETMIVALPYMIPTFRGRHDHSQDVFRFLEERGLPFKRWDEIELERDFAEVTFVENPYDYTRPQGWKIPDLVRACARLAYVPYGVEIGGGTTNAEYQYNQPLQQFAWAIFARSERQKALFAQNCLTGAAHVFVTGHPRMDAIRDLESARDPIIESFVDGRRAVVWNPHLDVRLNGQPFGAGYSTFLRWRDFILDEFEQRQDLALILRPHPQLFSQLAEHGVWSEQQIDAYLERCEKLGNVTIDRRPSYLPAFAAASAMISDASSFLLEFPATGKPLLYLHNPFGPGLNSDGVFVTSYCHVAQEEEGVRRFLDMVAAGEDLGGEDRRAAYAEFMHHPPAGVGRAVKRLIESRLQAECVRAEAVELIA